MIPQTTPNQTAPNQNEDRALKQAVEILEGKSFIGRLTDMTGEPVTQLMKRLPSPITRQINRAVRAALSQALEVAMYKMRPSGQLPPIAFQLASTLTGGISGFIGLGALAVELPVTTTLMLRSIAGIAMKNGESMDQPASRLACVEVFGLGSRAKSDISGETSYYAARAFLAKAVSEATQNLIERSVAQTSAPAIVDLVTSVGSRFGVVVTEKVAAGAIPVIGAIGGAAVNLAFMQHFQQLAKAHFAVRRLERRYGAQLIRARYQSHDEARKARI